MRIVVTGAAGFIGSHTARALAAAGHDVLAIDALTQPVHEASSPPPELGDGISFVRGDVRERAVWERALDGAGAVVHLAAYQDYGVDYARFIEVNATSTALLYEVIAARAVALERVVIASSQSVYGEGQVRCDEHGIVVAAQRRPVDLARGDFDARCARCGVPGPPIAMTEGFASPHNAYGISKLAAERLGLVLGEQLGVPTTALRFAIVHGPGQSPRNAYSGLLRAAALSLRARRAPVMFEDGEQRRDYVAIGDAVRAIEVVLAHDDAPGRVFNVGGARSWSVREVLDALNALVPEPIEPRCDGRFRLGDVRHTIGDTGALRELGWEPATDLVQTWRAYWSWLATLDLPDDIVRDAFADMEEKGILRASDM